MKKALTILTIIMLVSIAVSAVAEVVVTGDMRIRPRMDLRSTTTYDSPNSNYQSFMTEDRTDGYYYYRARVNAKANIGDGWFSHIQLGSNGVAYWTGKFGAGSTPSGSSLPGAGRGTVDFMLLYFGRKMDKGGYMGGLIPINALANPLYDLHYYSNIMVDVPYFIFNNNGAHGFTGYINLSNGGKLNATLLVDDDNTQIETTLDSTASGVPNPITKTDNEMKDTYTFIFDAPLKLSDFTVQPVVMFTAITAEGMPKPMTYGANIATPKMGKWQFFGTFGASTQSEADTTTGTVEYSAWYARLKAVGMIGKGKMTAWVDMASKKFDANDYENKFTYFWIDYSIPVYKSDVGSVSVKPTWRHAMQTRESDAGFEYYDFSRDKIELTIDFKFK
ncbi:MAG: hypothetical protein DWP97_00205 [Calditrichaeota bacterium]|nr:MAG: hypothetical protein DWP97_00205 [Calditrichota bacterium]